MAESVEVNLLAFMSIDAAKEWHCGTQFKQALSQLLSLQEKLSVALRLESLVIDLAGSLLSFYPSH